MVAIFLLLTWLGGITSPGWCRKRREKKLPPEATEQEIELGKKAVKEFEKGEKLINDEKKLAALSQIAQRLAAVTERPKFQYTIKIVDSDAVNAFTFPGGFIYFTKALLDAAESEHELAAVLAHEIGHNVHLHALRAIKKQKKLEPLAWASILVMILSRDEAAAGAGMTLNQVVNAVLVGYSRELEEEADESAFECLRKAGYEPVGLLTFFEKLKHLEIKSGIDPQLKEYGSTHPAIEERIRKIKQKLLALEGQINRRKVTKGLKVDVKEVEVNGGKAAAIIVDGSTFCELAPPSSSEPVLERAKKVAGELDKLLSGGAQRFDFLIVEEEDKVYLQGRRTRFLEVMEADAALHQATRKELAKRWLDNLSHILLREQLRGPF